MANKPENAAEMSADYPRQKLYAQEIELATSSSPFYESCMRGAGYCLGTIGMCLPCICCCLNPYKIVEQGKVGLISRFGRYYKSVDPGLCRINIITEDIKNVDIKIQVTNIPRQQIMTKDNVQVEIDSVIYWEIADPYTATFLVADVQRALIERTQTMFRSCLGNRSIQDSIENREIIAHEIEALISEPAKSWGIKVESVLISDIIFSQELQETLSTAAKQMRVGEAKVILAKAEVESAKLMREAADILNTPAAMQIRYLETLSTMSKANGTKVIFMPPAGTGMGVTQARILENMADE